MRALDLVAGIAGLFDLRDIAVPSLDMGPRPTIDGHGPIPTRGRKTLHSYWKGVGVGRYTPHQGQRELARAARRAAGVGV